MSLLCEKLNDKQKADVKDIGFDGLLKLNIKKSYHGIVKYFIDQYDVSTSVFIVNQSCKFSVTEYDVCDIFCLPLSDNDVIKPSKDSLEYNLFEEWKRNLDCIGEKDISADVLYNKIVNELIDGGMSLRDIL